MAELTFTDLWELLNYDFETGKLFWRTRSLKWFKTDRHWNAWNVRFANKEALCVRDSHDYKHGTILNKKYLAHKIIWMMCFNKWPNIEIDHIDGNHLNNRIYNLREVTRRENLKNKTRMSTNKSGVTGVNWKKTRNKWNAYISTDAGQIYLGSFIDFDEAVRVRKAAEIQYGYHPNHGREKSLPAERSLHTRGPIDSNPFR